MKILLVEDDETKRARVVELLTSQTFVASIEVAEAMTYEEALTALNSSFFDLVILDLLLPGAGQAPSADSSRAIIHAAMLGTSTIPPTYIIGLTAHESIADEEEAFYEENLFSLERYSPTERGWERRLVSKIQYLLKSKNAAAAFRANSYDLDLVVLTARYENEFQPVYRHILDSTEAESHPGWPTKIKLGSVRLSPGRSLRAAVVCIGEMGMAPAAAVASQAIATFRPRLLSMVGMCCGFNTNACASPRKLMDVIVAREVECWEEGKYVDLAKSGSAREFRARSRARPVDDAIRGKVEAAVEMESDTLRPQLRQFAARSAFRKVRSHFGDDLVREVPDVRFDAMVSGSSVIANEDMIAEILTRQPKALGLDMELYGVYSAAEKCVGKRPSVLGIKGVADFGQVKKDDVAQAAASEASAIVLRGLLAHLGIF
jgi:nucleoside phosphorylase/CheY-like chemotaxis protein